MCLSAGPHGASPWPVYQHLGSAGAAPGTSWVQHVSLWAQVGDEGSGVLPGDLVRAAHGDQLLTQQDTVPCLDCAATPHRHCALPRLDLGAQMPSKLPDQVLAAAH